MYFLEYKNSKKLYNAKYTYWPSSRDTSPNADGSFAKGYYFWNGYRADSSA